MLFNKTIILHEYYFFFQLINIKNMCFDCKTCLLNIKRHIVLYIIGIITSDPLTTCFVHIYDIYYCQLKIFLILFCFVFMMLFFLVTVIITSKIMILTQTQLKLTNMINSVNISIDLSIQFEMQNCSKLCEMWI